MVRPVILIVDDDPEQLELFGLMLRRLPYAITTAANAEEALHDVYTAPPALVILDVLMPQVDGLTLLRALRADERWANMKVILLTVMGDRLSSVDAALANTVLAKPIHRSVLEQEITRLLQ
jgi:CheY-like chemotaxis protein